MEFGGLVNDSSVLVEQPALAVTYITLLTAAALSGTLGNLLVIASLLILIRKRRSRDQVHGYVFIFNLACSDLVVTALINPFAVLGVVYGEDMYAGHFGLCRFLASICIISCVVSLLSIGCIAGNRYLYICHHTKHSSIITQHSSIALCVLTWIVGVLLDLPSHLSWSRHTFDQKAQKCLWDRRYNYYYSVFFVTTGMLLPLAVITVMYVLVFIKVSVIKSRVAQQVHHSRHSTMIKALQQTRMMFVVFVAFVVCWIPYICVLLIDRHDTLSMELHLYVSLTAHLHASVNFLIYGVCNKQIRSTYKLILWKHVLHRRAAAAHVLASSTRPVLDGSGRKLRARSSPNVLNMPLSTEPTLRLAQHGTPQETMLLQPNPVQNGVEIKQESIL